MALWRETVERERVVKLKPTQNSIAPFRRNDPHEAAESGENRRKMIFSLLWTAVSLLSWTMGSQRGLFALAAGVLGLGGGSSSLLGLFSGLFTFFFAPQVHNSFLNALFYPFISHCTDFPLRWCL